MWLNLLSETRAGSSSLKNTVFKFKFNYNIFKFLINKMANLMIPRARHLLAVRGGKLQNGEFIGPIGGMIAAGY